MALQYDAEFAALAGSQLTAQSIGLPVHDIQARRARMEAFVAAAGGYEVPIYHLSNTDRPIDSGLTPAILHFHGGGSIGVSAEDSTPSIAAYVSHSGVPIFSVDYRLASENPFPVPVEDCWTALLWLQSQAGLFGIDVNRIAIMGESAGGDLAAGLAQLARDRSLSPPLANQILIYPMLDDRTVSDHTGGLAIFSVDDVITGWAAYLGDEYGTDGVSPYAAAARATDVKGLAPLYLDVGHLDMFVRENLAHVQKLIAADVPTEFHLYTGVPHAFHRFAATASVTRRAFANRVGAIMSL